MKNTIVGVYDTLETAERVRDDVRASGVDMGDIRVISPDDVRENDPVDRDSESKSMTDSISDFFTSMFGEDDTDKVGDRYLDAARAGSSLVVVDIDSDDNDVDAARVNEIIESHGSTGGGQHRRNTSDGSMGDPSATGRTESSNQAGRTGGSAANSTTGSAMDRDSNDTLGNEDATDANSTSANRKDSATTV